jgi:hypothetical protein
MATNGLIHDLGAGRIIVPLFRVVELEIALWLMDTYDCFDVG